jgi:hypothetical protein
VSALLDADDIPELGAFFLSGDEGTYKGGPIDSIAPVYEELLEEDEASEEAFFAQIAARDERRARYQKQVARFVGVLGLAVVVALMVRLTTRSDPGDALAAIDVAPAQAATNVVPPSPAPVAPAAVNAEAPVVAESAHTEALAPEAPPAATVPDAPAAVEPAPVELPDMQLVAETPKAPVAATKVQPMKAAPAVTPPSTKARPKPKTVRAPAAAPARSLGLGSLQVVHAPPTAIFPN